MIDKNLNFHYSWSKQPEAMKATLVDAVAPSTSIQLTSRPEWAHRTESYRTVHSALDSVRLALDTIEREPNIPPVRYGTIYFASGI